MSLCTLVRQGSVCRLGVLLLVSTGACASPKPGDSESPTETGEGDTAGPETARDTADDTAPDTTDSETEGPTRWTAVSVGFHLACGIREDEMIQCWGGEEWEDRNDHDWDDRDEDEPPAGHYVQVHMPVAESDTYGGWHGCAITTDGAAVCWGRDGYGEASPPPGSFVDIATDIHLSCGLTEAGSPVCWGDAIETPTEIASRSYTSIDVTWGVACALGEDGQVYCWLPTGRAPFDVPIGVYTAFEYQRGELCTIDKAASLACWYAPPVGYEDSLFPPPPEGSFTDVCVGGNFACAMDEAGFPSCWGRVDWEVAIPVEPLAAISCGYDNACGVTPDHRILCWGSNSLGQADVPY
jgi:hypothetical protein